MEAQLTQPPQPPEPTPKSVAEIGSLARAVEAERAGRYVEAWTEALKAISLRPFHPEAYIQMASTAVAAGDPEAALRAAQRALALTPKWPTAQQVVTALERTLKARGNQRQKTHPIAWPELPDPNRKPRLSVCMIVKNEERFLGQCLASVKDIADELIVIDTGSTDRTVEIAREQGAQVGHFEWCNDFAAARNASIAPATGDWILFLDADEELSPSEKQHLPGLLNSHNTALIRLPLINAHQGQISRSILPRLFRNIPTVQFQGCVHEGVYTSILKISNEWQMEISVGNLLILHHGYTPEVISERNKVQRNYELLLKALEERPNEAYFYMQLGLELRRLERLDESFEAYAKALTLADTQPEQLITDEVRETLLTQYSGYLLADKQYEKVLEVLTSDLALRKPLTPGQLLVRGRALIHLRQPQYALNDVQEAYARREEPTLFPSAIDPMGFEMERILAEVYYLNNKPQKSINIIESLFKNNFRDLQAVLLYVSCLNSLSKTADSLSYLRGYSVVNNSPEIWVHGARIISSHIALNDQLKDWVDEGLIFFPEDKTLLKMRCHNPELPADDLSAGLTIKSNSNPMIDFDGRGRPRTTIICAVWNKDVNRKELLIGHSDNILKQTRSVEVIYVFDGGDTPPSNIKGKTVATNDHLTIYQAWNLALSLVETPYVMNLNLDDRLNIDAVEILERILDSDQSIGLVGGDWKVCFDQKTTDLVDRCSPCDKYEFLPDWPPIPQKNTRLGSGDGSRGTYGPACMWRMEIHKLIPRYPWRLKNGCKLKVVSDAVWWSLIRNSTSYNLYRSCLIIGNYYSHPSEQAEFRDKNVDEIRLANVVGVCVL